MKTNLYVFLLKLLLIHVHHQNFMSMRYVSRQKKQTDVNKVCDFQSAGAVHHHPSAATARLGSRARQAKCESQGVSKGPPPQIHTCQELLATGPQPHSRTVRPAVVTVLKFAVFLAEFVMLYASCMVLRAGQKGKGYDNKTLFQARSKTTIPTKLLGLVWWTGK